MVTIFPSSSDSWHLKWQMDSFCRIMILSIMIITIMSGEKLALLKIKCHCFIYLASINFLHFLQLWEITCVSIMKLFKDVCEVTATFQLWPLIYNYLIKCKQNQKYLSYWYSSAFLVPYSWYRKITWKHDLPRLLFINISEPTLAVLALTRALAVCNLTCTHSF